MSEPLAGRDVIFEFVTIGAYVKATAVDVQTMTEVSISGPKGTPDEILKRNAISRLEYVLRKKGLIA